MRDGSGNTGRTVGTGNTTLVDSKGWEFQVRLGMDLACEARVRVIASLVLRGEAMTPPPFTATASRLVFVDIFR